MVFLRETLSKMARVFRVRFPGWRDAGILTRFRLMKRLRALWMGDLPLGDAFWTWVVFGGLLVNISSSIAFLGLITADLPWAALAVGYGLSIPYNAVALVGVWRSAARHEGPRTEADLARMASAILLAVLSLT